MSPANKYSNLFIIQRFPIAQGKLLAKLALRRSGYVREIHVSLSASLFLLLVWRIGGAMKAL
jgi:hypothetical protein|tara:strand:- start:87 stop:272 length:186 start_codon:yes stop_codon:yes gene_type:complete